MSTNWLKDVQEFRKACGLEDQSSYRAWKCVIEEYHEWLYGVASEAKSLDACVDLIVTIIGYAEVCGFPLQAAWDEVHAANMRKVGGPKSADGKQLKPKGWVGPDIEGLLQREKEINQNEGKNKKRLENL